MAIGMICRPVCWPLGPMVGGGVILGILAVAGVVFSLVMLIDCLKRSAKRFPNPLTKNGEYDKLIWADFVFVSDQDLSNGESHLCFNILAIV